MDEQDISQQVNIESIPSMPHLAAQVLRLIGAPDSNAQEVAKVIEQDQAMTLRILQVANSPVYRRVREINSIQSAISIMGYAAIKGLVIASSTKNMIKNLGLLEMLFWSHGIGAACAARDLAELTRIMPPDEAFTAGLLHDIPRVILATMNRDGYDAIMKEFYNKNLPPALVLRKEKKLFGFAHPELAPLVAEKWGLSETIRIGMQYHHVSESLIEQAEPDNKTMNIAALICLANMIQYRLGIGCREPMDFDVMDHAAARRLAVPRDKVEAMFDSIVATVEEQRKTMMG